MTRCGKEEINEKSILAIPAEYVLGVITACLIGIAVGSYFDLQISMGLVNRNTLGDLFATLGPFPPYSLMPIGWGCMCAGLYKMIRGNEWKTRIALVFAWALAVVISDWYYGGIVRMLFGYVIKESETLLSIAEWLFWAVAYALIPFVMMRFLDDSNPGKLIAVGAALWVSKFLADAAVSRLKVFGSRPRFIYLQTLEDPVAAYREWWQFMPGVAEGNSSLQSWPSGHMSIVGVLFALPLLADCMKNSNPRRSRAVFLFVCVYVALVGYNRIHMAAHFLSDVCFGTLESFLITTIVCTVFVRISSRFSQKEF